MQRPNRFILLLLLCITGILIYSGCSASSNAIRYSSQKEDQKENNSTTRFTDQNYDSGDSVYSDASDSMDTDSDTSDPDVIPADSKKIDIAQILKKYGDSSSKKEIDADISDNREKVLMEIIKYLNTPYKYGGNSEKGIDCSAFTQTVFNNALSLSLDRSAREQFHEGETVYSRDKLEFGDLVFFNTRRRIKPGHVGIYIGDHLFAHASSKSGVIVSSLDDSYYSKRYMGARRIKNLVGIEKFSGSN